VFLIFQASTLKIHFFQGGGVVSGMALFSILRGILAVLRGWAVKQARQWLKTVFWGKSAQIRKFGWTNNILSRMCGFKSKEKSFI
jgi:hypothetical protein